MSHVFISYARRDGAAYADRLQIGLEAKGYRTWRDTRDIDPDKDFTATVEDAIERASYVVVCLTPDVKRKPTAEEYASFVRLEIGYARAVKKPMYVVTFDPKIVAPIYLINHSYVYFDPQNDGAWSSAFGRLCTMLDRPVSEFVQPDLDAAADDPFRPYVEKLLKTSSDYLRRNILRIDDREESHIELHVIDTPEAVPEQPPQMLDLMMMDEQAGVAFRTFPEAFAHFGRRVLLLGEPGAGKTITLMATARKAASERLADPAAPLPLYGLLAMWNSLKQTPLAEWLGNSDRLLTPDQVRGVMDAGKALLLLDGLDEMGGNRTEKQKIINKVTRTTEEIEVHYDPRKRFLNALKAQLGQNHALVTCRISDYKAVGDLVALDGAVTLQKLTDTQLRDYLNDLPKLLQAVESDESLKELSHTPLLLSFFAFAFRDREGELTGLEDLREGALRDAIFNAYMEKRYAHEKQRLRRIGEKPYFTLEQIREVLGRVAMENAGGMHRRSNRLAPGHRHVDNILEMHDFRLVLDINTIDTFIQFVVELHYLQNSQNSNYSFVHLLLRDTLIKDFSLPRLRDRSLYTDQSEPNPALALGCIKDHRTCIPLIQLAEDDGVEALLRTCANAGLGRLGYRYAVKSLILCLDDTNPKVRSRAAEALGQVGDATVIEPLLSRLSDSDAYVRSRVVRALGHFKNIDIVGHLQYVLSDPFVDVRLGTVFTLGARHNSRSVEFLLQALSDSDSRVRSRAAEELGKIGDIRAVEYLIRSLADPSASVRHNAATALREFSDIAVKPITRALFDPVAHIRANAAALLSNSSDYSIVPSIIEALKDPIADVRSNAASALGTLGDIRAIEPLIDALSDLDSTVCHSIVCALRQLGKDALEALLRSLSNQNAAIRFGSAFVLGELRDVQAVSSLINLLDDKNTRHSIAYDRVCDVAARALEKIGTSEAFTAVRKWRVQEDVDF